MASEAIEHWRRPHPAKRVRTKASASDACEELRLVGVERSGALAGPVIIYILRVHLLNTQVHAKVRVLEFWNFPSYALLIFFMPDKASERAIIADYHDKAHIK